MWKKPQNSLSNNNDAHTITAYGCLVRPNAQVVALRVHAALKSSPKSHTPPHYVPISGLDKHKGCVSIARAHRAHDREKLFFFLLQLATFLLKQTILHPRNVWRVPRFDVHSFGEICTAMGTRERRGDVAILIFPHYWDPEKAGVMWPY